MTLERRMAALEQRHRRLRHAFQATLVVLVATVLLGQAVPSKQVLEAERIVLRDSQGTQRAVLSVSPDENITGLALYNRNGDSRVILSAAEDGTSTFTLINGDGKAQLVARVKGTGKASVTVADDSGRPRATLGVSDTGTATVGLRDGRRRMATLTLDNSGSSGLTLNDRDGRERVRVTVGADGMADIATFDHEGNRLD